MSRSLDKTLFKDCEHATHSMIWMHGLGANAQDMMMLVEQMQLDLPFRFAFMNADIRAVTINNFMPLPAWYDIVGMDLNNRQDKIGISESQVRIEQVIEHEIAQGILPQNIFLAGFSQGGAMALYAGLKHQQRLAGIIALSAYLPLADEFAPDSVHYPELPLFMAAGEQDPLVFPQWSQQSAQKLMSLGYEQVKLITYPMEHAVCIEEIRDLSHWIRQQIEV